MVNMTRVESRLYYGEGRIVMLNEKNSITPPESRDFVIYTRVCNYGLVPMDA